MREGMSASCEQMRMRITGRKLSVTLLQSARPPPDPELADLEVSTKIDERRKIAELREQMRGSNSEGSEVLQGFNFPPVWKMIPICGVVRVVRKQRH